MRNTSTLRFPSQQSERERVRVGECRYFTYNDVNLVTDIKYPGGQTNRFWYDALLRRYAMEDSSGLSYFTWDSNGMNLLAERDSSGTVIAEYTHGYTPVDGIGSGVGQKLVQGGSTYHEWDAARDNRGSVYGRVNDLGQRTGAFNYNVFGESLHEEEVGAETRFTFQPNWMKSRDGRFYISPTRVYDPRLARFLQRDPLGTIGVEQYVRHDIPFARQFDPNRRRTLSPRGRASMSPDRIDATGMWFSTPIGPEHSDLTKSALRAVFGNSLDRDYSASMDRGNVKTDATYSNLLWMVYGFTAFEAVRHYMTGVGDTKAAAKLKADQRIASFVKRAQQAWSIGIADQKAGKRQQGYAHCSRGWNLLGTAFHTYQDKFAHSDSKWMPMTSSEHGGTFAYGAGDWRGLIVPALMVHKLLKFLWRDMRAMNRRRYQMADTFGIALLRAAIANGGPDGTGSCNCISKVRPPATPLSTAGVVSSAKGDERRPVYVFITPQYDPSTGQEMPVETPTGAVGMTLGGPHSFPVYQLQ